MKKILMLVLLLLAGATTASAQFATGKPNNPKGGSAASDDERNRVFASYNLISIEKLDLNGFSVGYEHAFSVSRSIPLFIKVSPHFTYGAASEKAAGFDDWDWDEEEWDWDKYRVNRTRGGYYDDEDWEDWEDASDGETKYTYMAVNVPVSVAYRIAVGNRVSIEPYVGVNFRFNVVGKAKTGNYKQNYFKKEDVGGSDNTWNRFQMGGQIGVGVNYRRLYAGIGYGFDFMELAKKTNVSVLSISLGYNF